MVAGAQSTRTGLKEKSNRNPIDLTEAYCFGPFVLLPWQRKLTRHGKPVPLTPKSFDLLVLLAKRAGGLVSKQEIWQAIWPGMQVDDANLTNAIVSIRRALGKKSIRTKPKHGYELTVPLVGRPGVPSEIRDLFEEANALLRLRSPQAIMKARNLYWICLANAPGFAPAWAWLGRCCRLLAKYGIDPEETMRMAEAAFERALAIDPDLACAHQFYAMLEADRGQASRAMVRLVKHVGAHPREGESIAGLIGVLRYCGLLPESVAAHRRVLALDPFLQTSAPHSLFNLCDFAGVIDAYSGVAQANMRGYLDLAAWAALGNEERAATLARERMRSNAQPPLLHTLVASLLAALDGDTDKVQALMADLQLANDPESALYVARHLCRAGDVARSLELLRQTVEHGYGCGNMLAHDPWLAKVRQLAAYRKIFKAACKIETNARGAFRAAGGERLLRSWNCDMPASR